MKLLITAGNTQTPIDRVRCLTNIFTGRTGAEIAAVAAARRHGATLLTSHPEAVPLPPAVRVLTYRTFDELRAQMESQIRGGEYEAVIHAAAVGDYELADVYAGPPASSPPLGDVGKIKGNYPEVWLKLRPAPKLIDLIRQPWGFSGILVKFKLEAGLDRERLLAVAEDSRRQSHADLMVANTFEKRHEEAWIGAGQYERVARAELAARLLERVEALARND